MDEDLSDGKYRNPYCHTCRLTYSDPDVIRVGDDY